MANALAVLVLVFLVWLWLDSARARELATAIAQTACEKRHLQFLDDTVALTRIALRRTPHGLRLRRMFRFDYSTSGNERSTGYVILISTQLELLDLGLPNDESPQSQETPTAPPTQATVIRFPTDRRH